MQKGPKAMHIVIHIYIRKKCFKYKCLYLKKMFYNFFFYLKKNDLIAVQHISPLVINSIWKT